MFQNQFQIIIQSREITEDELKKEVNHMMDTMHAYYKSDAAQR